MEIKRTLRERKFIDSYIKNNGNATKAYLAISPEAKYPREYGHRMLQKVNISVPEVLNEMGMTDIYLNKKLHEGLNATKVISVVPIPPKEAEPSTGDLPNANSKNVDFIDVEDYNVRVKYLDMALKLKGEYPATKTISELTGADGSPLTFIVEKSYKEPKDEEIEKKDEE